MRRRNYSRKRYNSRYTPKRNIFAYKRAVLPPRINSLINIDISDEVVDALQIVLKKRVFPHQFQCECGEINNFLLLFTNDTEYINAINKHGYRYTDMNDNIICAKCGKIYNFSNIRQTINNAHILLNNSGYNNI